MRKKEPLRAAIVEIDGKNVLRLNGKEFRYLLKDSAAFSSLGFFAGMMLGVFVFVMLKDSKTIDMKYVWLAFAGIPLLSIIITNFLCFKNEKEIKPFYVFFDGKKYELWQKNKRNKALNGDLKEINMQIHGDDSDGDKKTIWIKDSKGDYLYKGRNFIKSDIQTIKSYFRKFNIEMY